MQSLSNRTYWHLYTIDARNVSFDWAKNKNCSPDNPIISSNAASASLPEFDKMTNEIKLKVASPHFQMDGKTLETGQFRAVVSLKGISCLWGIASNAIPQQASVRVTYDDGQSSAAVVSTQVKDQPFSISASGYHYSSPTVRLKILSEVVISTPKKISILCAKGKLQKKITGLSPKCPTGYKQK